MKKLKLVIYTMVTALLLSSCSMIPVTKLEAMFGADSGTSISSGDLNGNSGIVSGTADTVTISRADYEKYQKFSEMFSLMDAAEEMFYQDYDESKMVEYATRGLMAGLEDPYSFYYNPEEFKQLWEDDEGNYVGIGVMIQSNMETHICTIIRVFSGGPAEAAGVQRGDILYRVGEDRVLPASHTQRHPCGSRRREPHSCEGCRSYDSAGQGWSGG